MVNKGKNRYLKRAHISDSKFGEILRCFSLDITATKTSELTGISRPTTNRIYKKLREMIEIYATMNFHLAVR
jgi:transposase